MTHIVDSRLLAQFRDEDTDLWVEAAIKIGRQGPSIIPFLNQFLSSTDNIHAHRHAWCALASFLDSGQEFTDTRLRIVEEKRQGKGGSVDVVAEVDDIHQWLEQWLGKTVLHGLILDGTSSLGQLSEFGFFKRYREAKLDGFQKRRDKVQGNEKALESIGIQEQAWLDASTPINHPKLGIKVGLPYEFWVLSSFIAGASIELLARLNIPFELFVLSLSKIAEQGNERIAFVSNIPRLLTRLSNDDEIVASCVGTLIKHLPDPQKNWVHWTNYVEDLAQLSESVEVELHEELLRRIKLMLSDNLKLPFSHWSEEKTEASAILLSRAAQEKFCDEIDWRELTDEEQMSLPVFYLVMKRPGNISASGRFSLAHRIERVFSLINIWRGRNKEIVLVLARLLKGLLYAQLMEMKKSQSPLAVCERQIYRVQTLIDDWNLRGTLPKDLATIVSRALLKAYQYSPTSSAPESYLNLLYTVMSAVPEAKLLHEMRLYTQHEVLERHLDSLTRLLSGIDQPEPDQDYFELYKAYASSIWDKEDDTAWREGLVRVVSILSREVEGQNFGENERNVLRWILEKKLRWVVARDAGFPEAVTGSFKIEFEQEVDILTTRKAQEIERLIIEITANERLLNAEISDAALLIETLRETMPLLRELREKVRAVFPIAERELISHKLRVLGLNLEKRFEALAAVVETEDELRANKIVQHKADKAIGDNGKRFVANWMLQRYMLAELVPVDARLVERLLDWKFVFAWVVSPFIFSAIINVSIPSGLAPNTANLLVGAPFVVIVLLNLIFLTYYLAGASRLPGGLPRASLLMPQIVGALFLGIVQTFSADESWGAGYLGNPFMKSLKMILFLGVSYFFVRYVMLKGQSPKVDSNDENQVTKLRNTILRKRSFGLMSLGVWQAFTLVCLFSVFEGSVMAGFNRADLISISTENMPVIAQQLDQLVPNMIPVHIGDPAWLSFYILPWAILSWTIQLFFFSAIFERIMNRS